MTASASISAMYISICVVRCVFFSFIHAKIATSTASRVNTMDGCSMSMYVPAIIEVLIPLKNPVRLSQKDDSMPPHAVSMLLMNDDI